MGTWELQLYVYCRSASEVASATAAPVFRSARSNFYLYDDPKIRCGVRRRYNPYVKRATLLSCPCRVKRTNCSNNKRNIDLCYDCGTGLDPKVNRGRDCGELAWKSI